MKPFKNSKPFSRFHKLLLMMLIISLLLVRFTAQTCVDHPGMDSAGRNCSDHAWFSGSMCQDP